MARYLTSDTLIDSIIRRAQLPVTQVTFKDEDFLQFATEELDMALLPYILSHHEDYYLTSESIPLVSGESRYEIPYRAIGAKLNDVMFVDSGGHHYEMTRVTKADSPHYFISGTIATIQAFYVEGNEIVLLPESRDYTGGSLLMSFYLRPNALVAESRAMTITAVDRITGVITVDSVPTIFTAGATIDLIKTRSPHNTLAWDVAIVSTDTANNTITLAAADIPDTVKVGDYICLSEECIIPQIPTDLHSMLAQRVACRCLEALGDQTGLAAANTKLAEMESKGSTIIDSRVESAPLKVTNRHGFLRSYNKFVRR